METQLQHSISKLPAWARKHIENLEIKAASLSMGMDSLRKQMSAAENKIRRIEDRCAAMADLMGAAARG